MIDDGSCCGWVAVGFWLMGEAVWRSNPLVKAICARARGHYVPPGGNWTGRDCNFEI